MFSTLAKLTPPRVPPPAAERERLLTAVSELATLSESVPVPPSIVMVEVEALLMVKASVPP